MNKAELVTAMLITGGAMLWTGFLWPSGGAFHLAGGLLVMFALLGANRR